MEDAHKRLLGARILSEANDLKRTTVALAEELGYSETELAETLAGRRPLEALYALIDRMEEVYPIDGADLRLAPDDCRAGAKLMRAAESAATSRVFERPDRSGAQSAYYEYRDTACSRLSPFRPEWIRELRVVEDADPSNPDVAFNKGHFLHQYTFYVGPVNFYWEVRGERHGRAMTTGDSTYGTPWWPHTFTSRSRSERALILAVTFGGDVRRAQKELYSFGARTRRFVLSLRRHRVALADLVRQHMACGMLSEEGLAEALRGRGSALTPGEIFDESRPLDLEELRELAACLDVELSDLLLPAVSEGDEVVVARGDAAPSHYPSRSEPAYRVRPMARVTRLAQMRGLSLDALRARPSADTAICHCLHTWAYNYGTEPARLMWTDGREEQESVLQPDDSVYFQPFISHSYTRIGRGEPSICEVRVPGALGLSAQRELSSFSDVERVFLETTRWF